VPDVQRPSSLVGHLSPLQVRPVTAARGTALAARIAAPLPAADPRDQLDAALQSAQTCIDLDPSEDAYRLLAICHLLRGDFAAAVETAEEVLIRKT
jgi:tetratricopeptide (TPR) repeat protein